MAYEELEGSPTFKFGVEGCSATRVLLIEWDDINLFMNVLFPFGDEILAARFPGLPWLRLKNVNIEPHVPDGMIPESYPVNRYRGGAKLTLEYDSVLQADVLTHRMSIGAEFITYPSCGLVWNSDNVSAGEEVQAGKRQAIIEHTFTWPNVVNPPLQAIVELAGKVNQELIFDCPLETLLFVGAEIERKVAASGHTCFMLEYKFAFKNNGDNDNPRGWNYFLRTTKPRAPAFEPTFERLDVSGGLFIYERGDFTRLFQPP